MRREYAPRIGRAATGTADLYAGARSGQDGREREGRRIQAAGAGAGYTYLKNL
jgi:hypothetical protein